MKSQTLYGCCMGLLLLLLSLPLVQEQTGLFAPEPLAGVEALQDSVPLKAATWWDGSFQQNFELRMYNWMGLRPWMVRLRNQLDYSLFGELYRSIMMGEEGELYRRGSVDAMRGRDFAGEEQIRQQVQLTAVLQQQLKARGILFWVVITPTKLRCMPGKLRFPEAVGPGNYASYVAEFQRQGVDFLDLTPVLVEEVARSPYRIFPKTGTHWTDYGALQGMRAIQRGLEQRSGKRMRAYRPTSIEMSLDMRGTDADAGELLNLMWSPQVDSIAYPQLQFQPPGEGIWRPRTLVIGDSFWWKIYDQGLHRELFAPGSQYRYYNWETYSDQWEGAVTIPNLDLRQAVTGSEVVILCINEANLHRYPFNFVQQALGLNL